MHLTRIVKTLILGKRCVFKFSDVYRRVWLPRCIKQDVEGLDYFIGCDRYLRNVNLNHLSKKIYLKCLVFCYMLLHETICLIIKHITIMLFTLSYCQSSQTKITASIWHLSKYFFVSIL